MSKQEATTVDEVDPLAVPGDASDLPAAWEHPEGENLPAIPDKSAPLEARTSSRPNCTLCNGWETCP